MRNGKDKTLSRASFPSAPYTHFFKEYYGPGDLIVSGIPEIKHSMRTGFLEKKAFPDKRESPVFHFNDIKFTLLDIIVQIK